MKNKSVYFISIKTFILIYLYSFHYLYSQSSGPTSPEVSSFETVNIENNVNPVTGDFVYSINLIEIPGAPGGSFPIGIHYHSGITYDAEASWVGLGWNLSVGHITRYKSGYPDEFKQANVNQTMQTDVRYSHSLSAGIGPANFKWSGNTFKGMTLQNISFKLGDIGIGLRKDKNKWKLNRASYGTTGFNFSPGAGMNSAQFDIHSSSFSAGINIFDILRLEYSRSKYWIDGTRNLKAYGYLNTQHWWLEAPWKDGNNYALEYESWRDWKADFFESSDVQSNWKYYLSASEDSYSVETEGLAGIFKPFRLDRMIYPSTNYSKNINTLRNMGYGIFLNEGNSSGNIAFRFLNDAGELYDNTDVSQFPTITTPSPISYLSKKIYPNYTNNKISGFVIYNNDGMIYEFKQPVYIINENNQGQNNSGSEYSLTSIDESYAYAWLLTAVKSSDYADLTWNGISEDDYGEWIKFSYETVQSSYDWRTPTTGVNPSDLIESNVDNFTSQYVKAWGQKEVVLLSSAETRTHICFFDKLDRYDAYSILSNGSIGNKRLKKLDGIYLYNKNNWVDSNSNGIVERNEVSNPIKSCSLTYDYSLAKGSPNSDSDQDGNFGEVATDGRLTLTEISKYELGSISAPPYEFSYYNNVNYTDRNKWDNWGYYCQRATNDDHRRLNTYGEAHNWSLSSIILPTGGSLEINYEDKNYKYVNQLTANNLMPTEQYKIGGGIRVKYLKTSDGINNYYRNYRYGDGVVTQEPAPYSYPGNDDRLSEYKYDYQLYRLAAPQVFYKTVKVFDSYDDQNVVTGYVLYTNTTPADYQVTRSFIDQENDYHTFVYRKDIYNSIYGLPKKIEYSDNTNQIVEKKEFTYSFEPQNVYRYDDEYGVGTSPESKRVGFINQEYKNKYIINPYNLMVITWGIENFYFPKTVSIKETSDGVEHITDFLTFDFKTGNNVDTKIYDTDNNNFIISEKPAYWYYGGMAEDNQLTHPFTKIKYSNSISDANVISASVSTWNTLYQNQWRINDTYEYLNNFSYLPFPNNYTYLYSTDDGYPLATSTFPWQKISNASKYDYFGNILQESKIDGNYNSTQIGYKNNLQEAIVSNSKNSEMSFNGFESGTYGDWDDWTNGTIGNTAHTGIKGWHFTDNPDQYVSKRIEAADLNLSGKYVLSGWVKTLLPSKPYPYLTISIYKNDGSAENIVKVASGNGQWEYVELPLDLSLYTNVHHIFIIARNGWTSTSTRAECDWDDLRFKPKDASMLTYTYNDMWNVTSITDDNNNTTYYEYDDAGRLKQVRDNEKNIVKQYQYNYKRNNLTDVSVKQEGGKR